MKKVGILVGREKTFPDALIKNINERGKGEVASRFHKAWRNQARRSATLRRSHRSHFSRSSLLSRNAEAHGA